MSIRQLSMFVENKKGALAHVLKQFSDNGIGLRAMTIADTRDFGILRVIVDDIEGAQKALHDAEIVFSVNEVIAAEAADVPGGLASVLNILMDEEIDIEYTYAFVVESGDRACAILRVSDVEAGEQVLSKAGVPLVTEDEILRI